MHETASSEESVSTLEQARDTTCASAENGKTKFEAGGRRGTASSSQNVAMGGTARSGLPVDGVGAQRWAAEVSGGTLKAGRSTASDEVPREVGQKTGKGASSLSISTGCGSLSANAVDVPKVTEE